jgi:hypothetical protein
VGFPTYISLYLYFHIPLITVLSSPVANHKLHFLMHIHINFGDSKESVATKVANVATGTFWLDSTGLDHF